jgi:hypothetical protein
MMTRDRQGDICLSFDAPVTMFGKKVSGECQAMIAGKGSLRAADSHISGRTPAHLSMDILAPRQCALLHGLHMLSDVIQNGDVLTPGILSGVSGIRTQESTARSGRKDICTTGLHLGIRQIENHEIL